MMHATIKLTNRKDTSEASLAFQFDPELGGIGSITYIRQISRSRSFMN
jgi:hypothetical protein